MRILLAVLSLIAAGTAAAREGDLDSRFSTDGLATVSYDTGASKREEARAVLVDPDGHYIVVGYVAYGSIGLAAFKADGTVDTSFGAGGKIARGVPGLIDVTAATIDPIGRIVVVGDQQKSGGVLFDFDPVVCRFNRYGFPDTNVSPNGCRSLPIDHVAGGTDTVSAVTTDGAGQIYLAGQAQISAEDYDFLVMKLDSPSAAPLSTFAGNGTVFVEFDVDPNHAGGDADGAQAILLQGNYLVVGGYAASDNGNDFALARLSALNGAEDTAFCVNNTVCAGTKRTQGKRTIAYDLGGANDDRVRALASTPDGKIIVAGEAERNVSGNVSNNYLVTRLNTDGTYTGSFGSGVVVYNSLLKYLTLTGVAVRSDGKILIAGDSSSQPGNVDPGRVLWITQLNANGNPDNAFAGSLGGGTTSTELAVFPTASDSNVTDHHGGQLTLDHGRIVLAGSRLWRHDLAGGIEDFDFGVVRLNGDSIFADGYQ